MFKKLLEGGQLQQLERMQIVTSVSDLHPPDDSAVQPFQPIPSMLHHVDKTDLEKFSLDDIFSHYDQEIVAAKET